ncbi:MAG: hypothetical protein K8T20_03785 [Planctomycetes bacterium]|nr:hypothetical protein [Planctomycetota bacterium]
MKTLFSSLAFALLLVTAVRADDTYDLKLKYVPKVGDVTKHTSQEKMEMKMVVSSGGKVMQDNDNKDVKSFEYTEEVVKVEADDMSEGKFVFAEAKHLVEGEEEDFGFKGKTVLGKKGKAGWEFTAEDGSELPEEDVDAIKDAVSKKDGKKEGKPDIQEVLAPGKPVKVGESWDLSAKKFAAGILEDEDSFDLEKSKGTLKLISVEKRDGALFGKMEGEIELSALSLGKAKLNKPISFKFKLNLDVCIDATQPNAILQMTAKMKGKRTTDAKGQEIELDIDMDMGGKTTIERKK